MSSSPTDSAAAATVEVTMPQMGVSVAEGTVVLWHKQPGDRVEADETVCEITTDKIDSEVPAPASGRLVEILVEAEQTVPVGTPLARIATGAGSPQAASAGGADGPARGATDGDPREGDAPTPPAATDGNAATTVDAPRPEGDAPASPETARAPAPGSANGDGAGPHYSPVVRRIAHREKVDLELVHGTGRDGRVRKQDVLEFLRARAAGSNGDGERNGEPPMHIESPYREEQPEPSTAREGADAAIAGREEPAARGAVGAAGGPAEGGARLSRMRRSIAAHVVESLRTAAHCTSITEADMSRIETARSALGLSYLPFVARCVIDALRAYPELNATLEGETLTRHRAVHLGIAVSLGRDGLIVPVVHDAHELSHEGLARRIGELARRARAGELVADEVRGGTFTITNPGGYGTIASTPIINQPQVAILDLEAVVKRPVVIADRDGGDAVAIRPMTNLCLSWDHRALDGALAAQFLSCVRDHIENWSV